MVGSVKGAASRAPHIGPQARHLAWTWRKRSSVAHTQDSTYPRRSRLPANAWTHSSTSSSSCPWSSPPPLMSPERAAPEPPRPPRPVNARETQVGLVCPRACEHAMQRTRSARVLHRCQGTGVNQARQLHTCVAYTATHGTAAACPCRSCFTPVSCLVSQHLCFCPAGPARLPLSSCSAGPSSGILAARLRLPLRSARCSSGPQQQDVNRQPHINSSIAA